MIQKLRRLHTRSGVTVLQFREPGGEWVTVPEVMEEAMQPIPMLTPTCADWHPAPSPEPLVERAGPIELKCTGLEDGRVYITSETLPGFRLVVQPGENLEAEVISALKVFYPYRIAAVARARMQEGAPSAPTELRPPPEYAEEPWHWLWDDIHREEIAARWFSGVDYWHIIGMNVVVLPSEMWRYRYLGPAKWKG